MRLFATALPARFHFVRPDFLPFWQTNRTKPASEKIKRADAPVNENPRLKGYIMETIIVLITVTFWSLSSNVCNEGDKKWQYDAATNFA